MFCRMLLSVCAFKHIFVVFTCLVCLLTDSLVYVVVGVCVCFMLMFHVLCV